MDWTSPSPWTAEEDDALQNQVEKYGPRNWFFISLSIPGRSGDACRHRWCNHLSLLLEHQVFTNDESKDIVQAQAHFGNNWALIARLFRGRTVKSIKNHWNSTLKHSDATSATSKPAIHDVFLSFRGEDTRKTFAAHLYAALSNAGVNACFDEYLCRGRELRAELKRLIQGARISIVVFSKNYASSGWCLYELLQILKCRTTHGHHVVPVFYDVNPSDVRHQTGYFGRGLEDLVRHILPRVTQNKLFQSWKKALTEAANLSGWSVMNSRNEVELLNDIVDDILGRLNMDLLSITDFPVGLESRVQQVIQFINGQSDAGCVVGIWGMGGLGKTTTAKAVYNKLSREFRRRSFIETNNREYIDLQEKLLLDVQKTKVKIHGIAMGISMIEKALCEERALVVIDDVTEFEQLKALCVNRKRIGVGIVIIITTRDVRLLNLLKADYVYELEEMDDSESLKLFSLHAFGEENPSEDFKELTRKVVSYCGGLPLALEVLGCYLIERKKKEWKSVLSQLKLIPYDQVQEKLRISFDGLRNQMERDIFLDVCCFFVGKDRVYVTEILNGCGLCADIGITILIERSLIKVEKNNKLGMHPLLRDMGRNIICQSSRNNPGKCRRLWFQKDVLDVLTNNKGTEVIQGLALKLHATDKDCFEAYAFKKMKGLRLLQLDHVQLSGNYGYLSKQLRWICWERFPLKYIPDKFDLKGVIAIDFKNSNLILLWEKPQVLECLKFLNLSHSKYLIETPDFSSLPSLEKLILKDCSNLCKVDKSIGDLHNLLLINLKDCVSLCNLPKEIYKLKSLKTLILSGCLKIDKLEEDIVQMESLTRLIATNTAVKQVPFSIVRSKSIGYISLCGYEGLSCNVFPSIIWSWMSPTMNPLSHIHAFGGTSSSLISMEKHNNSLGDLASMLNNLSNLRSVLVHCDTEFELSKQLRSISDSTKLKITSCTSQLSNHSLESFLIGSGSCEQVLNIVSKSISKGLATSEACNGFLPGDNYPYWLAYTGEGPSVYFTVPEDSCMKGMALCVVYLSTPENTATESLISVLMVNYTKCAIQIHKRDTVVSFNDEDWQNIISHLGSGDKVEIFVTFGYGLAVKQTIVYLIYGESVDMNMEQTLEPSEEPKSLRITKKIEMGPMAPKTLQDKNITITEAGSSERAFDAFKFISYTHDKRYHEIVKKKNIIQEKVFNLKAYQFPAIQEEIRCRKWQTLATFSTNSSPDLVKEFYANAYKEDENDTHFLSFVRGNKVYFDALSINSLLKISEETECSYALRTKRPADLDELITTLCKPGTAWVCGPDHIPQSLQSKHLFPEVQAWCTFVHQTILPCANVSDVIIQTAQLLCAIVKHETVNIGQIIAKDIQQVAQSANASLAHPSLICALCAKVGVIPQKEEPILRPMQPISAAWIARQDEGSIVPTQEQQPAAETPAQEQPGATHQPPPSQLEQRLKSIEQTQTQLQQDYIRLELSQARIERSLQSMSHFLALIYCSQRNSELMLKAIAPQFGFSDSSLGESPLGPLSAQDILQMVHFEDADEPTTIPASSEN